MEVFYMNDLVVKIIDLFGDSVMAAKDNDGNIWAGIRWFCYGLGMSEGQMKRQIKNIKEDTILGKGGSKFVLPTGNGDQEVFCLKIDFLPLWLTRISITPNMRKEHPELADKLLEYQLKAKDILAEAFLPKQETPPLTLKQQVQTIAQGAAELYERVEQVTAEVGNVKTEIEALRDELPLFPSEADKIKNAVNRKVVYLLGGKQSNAYKNKSLSKKVFINCYQTLKGNFEGIGKYTEIKRKYRYEALKIIEKYEPPFFLTQQIEMENAQIVLNLKGGAV